MKSGLTITEMAKEIERQAAAKADYLVNPLNMEMDPTGRVPMLRVVENGVDQMEPLSIQETAHRQLGTHLNIPWKYYERMLQEEPGLLADNVNRWLHRGEPTQRLLRTIDGRARAFLSNRYRCIDNFEIAQAVLPIIMEMQGARFESTQITENYMYNLARRLRERGEAASIDDVYMRYAHPDVLEGFLPIYMMNTEGTEHACVFLNDGGCSVYDSRPHVCRIYPFSVRPGQRGRIFEFYRCVDQHAAHFFGDRVHVKDWLHKNFARESREFWTAEGNILPVLGRLLRSLDANELQASLFQILHYRYYNFDLDQPFMPQYKANMAALERLLRQRLGEE